VGIPQHAIAWTQARDTVARAQLQGAHRIPGQLMGRRQQNEWIQLDRRWSLARLVRRTAFLYSCRLGIMEALLDAIKYFGQRLIIFKHSINRFCYLIQLYVGRVVSYRVRRRASRILRLWKRDYGFDKGVR
jgi:hypothetical protein